MGIKLWAMKYVKLIIIGAVALFIVMLVLSLLIPSHIKVSRAINLNADCDTVLKRIDDLKEWKKWYPGFENVNLTETVTKDNKIVAANAGGIRISVVMANDSVVAVQMFKSDRPVNVSWKLIHYSHVDSLTLHNSMDFDLKWYPWEKLSGLLFEKTYGPVMEEGLRKLAKGNGQ